MKFLSVCSGIEAASVAWEPLGWEAVAFSEIEPFPCSLLAHRFPHTPNLGDMTKFNEWKLNESIDVLVGGTPCQSFSIAGLRGGLDDPRGGLMLTFLKIAQKFQPRWIVWENVPGVLSSNGGRDFGSLLGGLEELGYGWSYRILDAQHFGVPQRRRRVFVVARLGRLPECWRELFFERQSLQGDLVPGGALREGEAPPGDSPGGAGSAGQKLIRPTTFYSYADDGTASTLKARDFRGWPFNLVIGGGWPVHMEHNPGKYPVRRLTLKERERLQGFPDGWTDVPHKGKPAADSPRYKAIGNSMAVPVMRWIGERIQLAEK